RPRSARGAYPERIPRHHDPLRCGAQVAFESFCPSTGFRPEAQMPYTTVSINRAPVLTLWGAVVAERLGFDEDAALTLGRAVAVLNAQSKGRKLGIFKPPEEEKKPKPEAPGETSR